MANKSKKEPNRVTEWLKLRDPVIQRFRDSSNHYLLEKNGLYSVYSKEPILPEHGLRRFEKANEEYVYKKRQDRILKKEQDQAAAEPPKTDLRIGFIPI